eukprot:TRINITY_DN20364_c0_g1_i1.p1 TRINITY_DN20364_c0_g1~~TRINITY_DN20364_c0_g1_i1.p1  ORF type:complete len:226 (+),score=15.02 TRINITY_DN20364_c0_g1_i1:575-1252(+)
MKSVETWGWDHDTLQGAKIYQQQLGIFLRGFMRAERHNITWDEETVKLWDASTSRQLSIFTDYAIDITGVLFSSDSNLVMAAYADGNLSIRSVNDPTPTIVRCHPKAMTCLSTVPFFPHHFVTASSDSTVKFWDIRNTSTCWQTTSALSPVTALHVGLGVLVPGGYDKKARIFSIQPFNNQIPFGLMRTLSHPQRITSIEGFQQNIILGGKNGLIKRWYSPSSVK